MTTTRAELPPLPDPADKPTLTVEEAGRYLGISRPTAYEAAKNGTLPVLRVNRRLLVPTAALRRMLALDMEATR
jgi:excisionase family DNA binding protein